MSAPAGPSATSTESAYPSGTPSNRASPTNTRTPSSTPPPAGASPSGSPSFSPSRSPRFAEDYEVVVTVELPEPAERGAVENLQRALLRAHCALQGP